MKTMKFLTIGFLLIGMTALVGCKKETPTPYGVSDSNIEEPTTGSLVVNARDAAGNSIINNYVYLYNNEADFNNVIYSKKQLTNNSGQVTFKNLTPGVYYADCDFQNQLGGTTTVYGKGSVSAGYITTITIKP